MVVKHIYYYACIVVILGAQAVFTLAYGGVAVGIAVYGPVQVYALLYVWCILLPLVAFDKVSQKVAKHYLF